jgi:hypothetical protein
MADPASIIGTVSAIISLAQICADYTSKFKDAHKDAMDLLTEVIAIAHVLSSLKDLFVEQRVAAARTSVLFFALNGCQERLHEIKAVVEPLVRRKKGLQGLWSRLKWPMERDDARDAVVALHRYTQIFHFAVNLDGL